MTTVTYEVDGVKMSEKEFANYIRDKYINNPPEGY